MEKITLGENQTIEINGAIINASCANWLLVYQDENNGTLNEIRENMAETVSSLLLAMEYVDTQTADQMLKQAQYLSLTSQNMKRFMKPE